MSSRLLHGFLLDSGQRRPERTLLLRRGAATSFGRADSASSALAAELARRGVGRGDRVGLLLDNLPEYPISYYGILKTGAAVVPLCPDTRQEPLARSLGHCEAKAVILERKNSALLAGCADRLPELRLIVSVGDPKPDAGDEIELARMEDLLASSDRLEDAGAGEEDLAAIMYTSGTTAEPKGVMLSHRNIVSNTLSTVEYLDLQEQERLALVLPFFYSYGNSLLHTHACVGGTLVDVGSVAFPAAVLRGVQDHRCTGLSGVPSTFARLVHSKLVDDFDLSSLRYLTQAGGPMTPALTEKLRRAIPGADLYVMYGQTEAAPRLSYLPPADLERKLGSVGKAIPGVTLDVLDERGAPVPPGVEGELVANGDNIMLGYWKDPDASARALRSEGLRTGDLARSDEDGFIYIVGRNSDMIKAGAHRIGPKEIESVIERLPEVSECAVAGIPDELLGEAIAVFIVLASGASLDEKQVMRTCLDRLPRFKLPNHVNFVESLPRTRTGKLRRSDLKSWRPLE